MAISKRTRTKGAQRSQELLPDARVTGYVVGRQGPNPVYVSLSIVGAFVAVTFLLYLLTGAILVPGILIFLLLQQAIVPVRALIVTDRGLALAKRSLLNGRPNSIISRLAPPGITDSRQEAGYVRLGLVDGQHIWLSAREEALLRAGPTA